MTIICLLTSFSALLVSSVAFYTYELQTFRERVAQEYIPLARAIIGGVLGATVLSLLVVPCLYVMLKQLSEVVLGLIRRLAI